MAHTERVVHAPPEVVFAVLTDPRAYQRFVVGTKKIRSFDARWPETGTALHHTVGVGPLALSDKTEAVGSDPPHHLVARPHIRPFVVTESRFALEDRGGDTLVHLDEYAISGHLAPVWPGPLDALMGLRNRLSLRRLARLAHRRVAIRRLDDPTETP